MELVVHDVVEQILERLPPKSLLRFKSISKQWKSTIESRVFQHNHLIHHRQISKTPHLLMINTGYKINGQRLESIITLGLESLTFRNIPISWESKIFSIFCISNFCQNSIDGLVCIYNSYDSVIIFNPTTRWYRILPPSTYQQSHSPRKLNPLGFGKDEINGLYKPVWLYNNSLELNSANATTCEVFDFNINDWRFIEPSSPKRIANSLNPVYLNGSLYWLTEKDEEGIKGVLSLDLHTETFEIVCKTPCKYMVLYNLNDNLCGSNGMGHGKVIWSLNLEEKTWKKLYNIDLLKICPFFGRCCCMLRPITFMGEKKKVMLFSYYCCVGGREQRLMIYDRDTTPVIFSHKFSTDYFSTRSVCYFQSLISIL